MQRITVIAALALIAGAIGGDAMEFAGGYNAFPLVTGLMPASLLLFALTAIATCVAAVVGLIALFRRRFTYTLILALAAVVCWLISPWFAGRSLFLRGLSVRLHQISSPAEIQSVAQICLSHTPTKPVFGRLRGYVYGPRKMMASNAAEAEQSTRVWEMISEHPFVHLDGDTCVIFVEPPVITFVWGGALPGHWGISVAGAAEPYPQTIRFSDDIMLFRGQ